MAAPIAETWSATAAAEVTLEILAQGDALRTIEARGTALMGWPTARILTEPILPNCFLGVPSCLDSSSGGEGPVDYPHLGRNDAALYEEIMRALIRNGAMPDPDGREPVVPVRRSVGRKTSRRTLNYFADAVEEVLDDKHAGDAWWLWGLCRGASLAFREGG